MTSTLALTLLACAATTDYQPVLDARIEMRDGLPQLLINGTPAPPLMFFPNTDIGGEYSIPFQRAQTRLARDAGIDLISFPLRVSRKNELKEPDFAHADACLARLVEENPKALFLLRMFPGPWPFWAEWKNIPEDQIACYADGTRDKISIASDYFWEASNTDFLETIRYLESGPYGDRILGYWLGGPQHEMFPDHYRSKGPDYCGANQARFRDWLRNHYRTDARLRAAWGRSEVTLDTAEIPATAPGRFPMRGTGQGETARIFYELPEERPWVDYSRYVSDIAADRILNWARLVKRETNGTKLTGFFYGYSMELSGSFSAHDQIGRVLDSPDVDLLGSPISYEGRRGGQPGGFMSLVDSITAHGKLWFNEDDTRTSTVDPEKLIEGIHHLWQGYAAESIPEDMGILGRNLGAVLTHRTGTWWMDLIGGGAFDRPAHWALMEARKPLFEEPRGPLRPDVAMLVDPLSRTVVASDWDMHYRNLGLVRNACMTTGVSVGFYDLRDFIDGVVPPCKAYLFTNAFALDESQIGAIRERLDREGATAVWLYASGCFGPSGFDAARARKTTGISLTQNDGMQGSTGQGPLDGFGWGWARRVSPRTIVDDAEATVLGHFNEDQAVSAAMKSVGHHTSVILCDVSPNDAVLRAVFEQAGAHVYTRQGEVVHTDGSVLVIHRAAPGEVTVSLPQGTRAEAIDAEILRQTDGEAVLHFSDYQTAWLRLAPKPGQ